MDKIMDYLSIIPKCMFIFLIDLFPVDAVFLFSPTLPADYAAWIFWLDVVKGVFFIVFTGLAIFSMPLLRKMVKIKRFKKVTKELFEKVDVNDELSDN